MRVLFIFYLVFFSACTHSQSTVKSPEKTTEKRPNLIIGITVDQMRYDYIERFWNDYSSGGFKLLVKDGFFCRNLNYNYAPTYTAPGHASIFTGTTPAYHGIISNDWYRREQRDTVYCTDDPRVVGVGTLSAAGKMSPVHLLSNTIGDELKIFSNERSKVIGIAMKDRGAILPAGRTADAAYWFVGRDEGVWVTSTWYQNQLPEWVKAFNKGGLASDYLSRGWHLLRPESTYDESMADNNQYEALFKGLIRPTFPYSLDSLLAQNGNMELIKATPWGNTLTLDFARAAIENENLGQDEFTDMLCISFSSTDYIGHQFGIHSRETQDCYLRLDQDIAEFITYLDYKLGRENYLIFLTADHGGAPTPSYTASLKSGASYWKPEPMVEAVEKMLDREFGDGNWILNYTNDQFLLDDKTISEKKIPKKKVEEMIVSECLNYEGVYQVYSSYDLRTGSLHVPFAESIQLGFNQKRSGDVCVIPNPGWIQYGNQGTTHGSVFRYDTHVPAIFFGAGVKKGETHAPFTICDIAPTICALSKLPYPDACIGNPILGAIE